MDDILSLKQAIFEHCRKLVDQKLLLLNTAYVESRAALESEAKSTAGDKHETGRAMIQLEQEKMSRQYSETEKLKNVLLRVPFDKAFDRVQSGALVQLNGTLYFIAIGLGKITVREQTVFVMAPASPLAQLMLGKMENEEIHFNGTPQKLQLIG